MKPATQQYFDLLPLATLIYDELYGKPKSHIEWANGFNIRGKVV